MPVLAGTIPCFEMLMLEWESMKEGLLHLSSFIQAGLEIAYKYYNKMDETNVYIVAMSKHICY